MTLSRRFVTVLAVTSVALLAVALPASAATPTIPDESFAGVSTPPGNWIVNGLNWTPCLTAATASILGSVPACVGGPFDPDGDGALRLTETVVQGGIAILNTPIDTSLGLQIEFDLYQYNTTDEGDGMAFFLIDGAANPTQAGSYGGGLGYASYHGNGTPGLVGGYVGIGFDAYGAFSNEFIGGGGNVGLLPNEIAIRGHEASDYALIESHVAAGSIAVPTATDRDDARRHVVVTISKLNVMSIDVDYGTGLVTEVSGLDLETVNGIGSLPTSLKLGFSGSTGGAYSRHEINNFEIQTLAPDLSLALSATPVDAATDSATVSATVTNAATTGATDGVITVTSTLPAGVVPTAAAGVGWTCGIAGQLVTCTRSGAGIDRLAAGEVAPPVAITVSVGSGVTLPTQVSASVTVLDDSGLANNSASAALVVGGSLADGGVEPVAAPLGALAMIAGMVLLLVRRRTARA